MRFGFFNNKPSPNGQPLNLQKNRGEVFILDTSRLFTRNILILAIQNSNPSLNPVSDVMGETDSYTAKKITTSRPPVILSVERGDRIVSE
jgi:hypothetical protein